MLLRCPHPRPSTPSQLAVKKLPWRSQRRNVSSAKLTREVGTDTKSAINNVGGILIASLVATAGRVSSAPNGEPDRYDTSAAGSRAIDQSCRLHIPLPVAVRQHLPAFFSNPGPLADVRSRRPSRCNPAERRDRLLLFAVQVVRLEGGYARRYDRPTTGAPNSPPLSELLLYEL